MEQPAPLAYGGGRVRLGAERRGRAVTGAGEQVLRAGECAGFPAGAPDGHHIQNRSSEEALLLEVGSRRPATDCVDYPDIDLRWSQATGDTHKDGTPY
jgi:uncharacterized cupin superfamily protein